MNVDAIKRFVHEFFIGRIQLSNTEFLDQLFRKLEDPGTCIWTEINTGDYRTACRKKLYGLIDAVEPPTPLLGYRYCPYCGKQIRVGAI